MFKTGKVKKGYARNVSDRCDGCFLNHFPSPNTLNCKFEKQGKVRDFINRRLRGGANGVSKMIGIALTNAERHGIKLHAGAPNSADGNCVFESIIDSINQRDSFQETLPESPDFYRKVWLEEVQSNGFDRWNLGKTVTEWDAEWNVLKSSKTYEYELGDVILPGIAHCIQKDILVFNTSVIASSPVYAIQSSTSTDRISNTEVPICLAYDQKHYEALFPDSEEDVLKTIALKRDIIEGRYDQMDIKIPVLRQRTTTQDKYLIKKPNSQDEYIGDTIEDRFNKLTELKKIRKKDRTNEQNELYQSLMKLQRVEKERQRKAATRKNQ